MVRAADRPVAREEDRAVVLALYVFVGSRMWDCRAYGFGDKIRPVVGYNGYTQTHLPMLDRNPELPRKTDAILASFAARMAFSSFAIRS